MVARTCSGTWSTAVSVHLEVQPGRVDPGRTQQLHRLVGIVGAGEARRRHVDGDRQVRRQGAQRVDGTSQDVEVDVGDEHRVLRHRPEDARLDRRAVRTHPAHQRLTGQRVVTDRMLELDLGLDGIADVTQREHPEVTVDHVHLVLGDRHPLDVAVGAHQAQPCARRPTDQVLGQTSDGGRAVVGMNEVGGNATG